MKSLNLSLLFIIIQIINICNGFLQRNETLTWDYIKNTKAEKCKTDKDCIGDFKCRSDNICQLEYYCIKKEFCIEKYKFEDYYKEYRENIDLEVKDCNKNEDCLSNICSNHTCIYNALFDCHNTNEKIDCGVEYGGNCEDDLDCFTRYCNTDDNTCREPGPFNILPALLFIALIITLISIMCCGCCCLCKMNKS